MQTKKPFVTGHDNHLGFWARFVDEIEPSVIHAANSTDAVDRIVALAYAMDVCGLKTEIGSLSQQLAAKRQALEELYANQRFYVWQGGG